MGTPITPNAPALMKLAHFDGGARAPRPTPRELMVGGLTEYIAMNFFVFFGCGAAASNAQFHSNSATFTPEWDSASVTVIALTFGLAITTLAFATAHTSGGHINCAVTFGLMIIGTCHPLRALVYVICQLLGSVTGAALLLAATAEGADGVSIDRTGGLGSNGFQNAHVTVGNAFMVEMMGTCLLMYVVLESAVNAASVTTTGGSGMIRGNKQNLAPFPIGFAVFLAHVVCIPVTGCSINPTRSFGPAVVASIDSGKSDVWDDHWVFWIAPLTGSLLATLVWKALKLLDPPIADEPA